MPAVFLIQADAVAGVLHADDDERVLTDAGQRVHPAELTGRGGQRLCGQGAGAHGDLATEPRLDVGRERLLVARDGKDDAVEEFVELGLNRGLVVEARELRHEPGDVLALVAGQVEPVLRVLDGVVGHVPDGDRRARAPAGENEDRRCGDEDDGNATEGDRPANAG